MEPLSKRVKSENEGVLCDPKPFTKQGFYDDEVTLKFGLKNLYVSKNFLCVASPVFEAMFRNEFKETKAKCVVMTGKSYEDFLDFLLCIHPRILQDINSKNVLRIVPLAEEYQVTAIVAKCKDVMRSMLLNAVKSQHREFNVYHLEPLRECFFVLQSAISLNFTEIRDSAVTTIARFGHVLYNGKNKQQINYSFGSYLNATVNNQAASTYGDVLKECRALFESFPLEIRNRILLERLEKVNNNEFK